MFKGLNGLNPGNQAFKQFKCPILNVLMNQHTYAAVFQWIFKWQRTYAVESAFVNAHFLCRKICNIRCDKRFRKECQKTVLWEQWREPRKATLPSGEWAQEPLPIPSRRRKTSRNSWYQGNPEGKLRSKICKVKLMLIKLSSLFSVL